MTKPKRPVLQVAMTETQMDLLDVVLKIIHHDRYTKTSYVLEAIRRDAKGFISIPEEIALTDEELCNLVIKENEDKIKNVIGHEKYNELLKQRENN